LLYVLLYVLSDSFYINKTAYQNNLTDAAASVVIIITR